MNAKQFSILVVEDEPDGQELVSRMLSQANVAVDVAGNAEEAWNFLMSNQYSAAIIDLALPERDGFELVTAIRGEADLTALPYRHGSMDAVICSAVLHFARDEAHWRAMVEEMWRVLVPGGLFFARLASTIGLERLTGAEPGRVRLPDGSTRFVVTESFLLDWTQRLGARLLDPIKTTNVQQMRAMTTWVLEK